MLNIYDEFEKVYDPTDSDKASKVAHRCLWLMRYCILAAESDGYGMKIGRDTAMELSARTFELAQTLGLLRWNNTAKDRKEFVDSLLQREEAKP